MITLDHSRQLILLQITSGVKLDASRLFAIDALKELSVRKHIFSNLSRMKTVEQ